MRQASLKVYLCLPLLFYMEKKYFPRDENEKVKQVNISKEVSIKREDFVKISLAFVSLFLYPQESLLLKCMENTLKLYRLR